MSRRDEVLQAALDLLDEIGLNALTVRRLTERLGVQPGALYRHFASKTALLDAMVTHLIAAESARGAEPGAAWDEQLGGAAQRLRQAMLAHRDGALLVITRLQPSDPRAVRLWDDLVEVVAAAGLGRDGATSAVDTVFAFTNGFTMEEQARDGFPGDVGRRAWRDAGFRAGLELIMSGVRAELTRPGTAAGARRR